MSSTSLSIMEIVSDLDVGGAQEVVRTLAENLTTAGCRVVVCTFRDGPLRHDIEQLGIPVEVLPARQHSVVALPAFTAEMQALRRHLLALIDCYDVNVVQTHLLRSMDFLVLSLRSSRDVQIYWTFQNALFDLRPDHLDRHGWLLRPKRLSHHLLYRAGARRVDGYIAVSEDVKRAILDTIPGIPPDKITVIFNSVDLTRYPARIDKTAVRTSLNLTPDDRVMAVVATFKRQKGHRYLIDAAAQIVADHPRLHILFIGDGELRADLEAHTRAHRLERHIHFLGTRSDVADLLAASDYFVLPSLWEGLSMALVEAMASGLPVIATAVSGTTQVIVDSKTGLLVPPGDADRLADALTQFLTDPASARVMGRFGRQRVERFFSARKQAADHIALFSREQAEAGWQLAPASRR